MFWMGYNRSILNVHQLLGLSTFLLESPIDIVLFIIIFFPSKKKKNYAVMRIVKHYGSLYSTSQKMLIMSPTYLTIDPLRSYSTFCEKPLLADLENRSLLGKFSQLKKSLKFNCSVIP
jgi:hypothetical protein